MKNFKIVILLSTLALTGTSFAETVPCEDEPGIQVPAAGLVKTLKAVTDGMYKDVATLKVNYDGEGKLSIFYENGEPKILRLTYKNKKGTVTAQKTFDELERGIPLIYDSKEKPGKAIVFEKGANFKDGSNYNFKLSVRSGYNPDSHTSYPIEFDSDINAPKLSSNSRPFKNMEFSPGVSMLSWDGTFKKVEFKN